MASSGFQDQPSPPEQPENISFVKEAFNLQYNWIAMVGVGAFALISGSLLPLILAGGLELMYLAIVPQNYRFQRLVRSWKFAERQKQKQQRLGEMLRSLPAEMQSRYIHSAQVCNSIRANFTQLSSTSQIFLQQIDSRLQGLLSGYARLLVAAAQQGGPGRGTLLDAQCAAVEDVLMLVRDQSVTMRDPQQVSERLETLVHDVEQTEQTVQQVEAIFNDLSPDLDGLMSLDGTSTSSGPSRVRISN